MTGRGSVDRAAMKRVLWAGLLMGVVAFGGMGGCASEKLKVPSTQRSEQLLETLPGPTRLAAAREVGMGGGTGGGVASARPMEVEGQTVYLIRFVDGERRPGLMQVTSDGRVLDRRVAEEKMAFDAVPGVVRRAALAQTGGVRPEAVYRESRSGEATGEREVYRFDVVLSGVEHSVLVDSGGSVLEESVAITPGQIPVVSRAAINRRFPGLAVERAAEVRTNPTLLTPSRVTYDVTGTWAESGGSRRVETTVGPDGTFESVLVLEDR